MAAPITNGGCWPFGEGRAPLGSVIILAAEDSIEHTTVPRLIAAGADLKRVHFVQAAVAEGGKGQRMFNFQADIAKLKALIREIGDVVLVIIDPVTAYMLSRAQNRKSLACVDRAMKRRPAKANGLPNRGYCPRREAQWRRDEDPTESRGIVMMCAQTGTQSGIDRHRSGCR
jgi:hypothetical protein